MSFKHASTSLLPPTSDGKSPKEQSPKKKDSPSIIKRTSSNLSATSHSLHSKKKKVLVAVALPPSTPEPPLTPELKDKIMFERLKVQETHRKREEERRREDTQKRREQERERARLTQIDQMTKGDVVRDIE